VDRFRNLNCSSSFISWNAVGCIELDTQQYTLFILGVLARRLAFAGREKAAIPLVVDVARLASEEANALLIMTGVAV
jgi:hypothetical protein